MTRLETLRGARSRVLQDGWFHRHHYIDANGVEQPAGHCASNAMTRTCNREHWDAHHLFAEVVTGRTYPEYGYDVLRAVWRWNDAPERTFQDVIDAFDAAIAIAEAQEQPEPSEADALAEVAW